MHQRFNQLFSSSSMNIAGDNLNENSEKLNSVEPVCTTITENRSGKRKKSPTTLTTTCVKELVINGQKHYYKEINTTDVRGTLIGHSKSYSTFSIVTNNNNNNRMPLKPGEEKQVIHY